MRSLDLRQTRPKRSHVAKKREEDTTWTCNRCTLAHNSSTSQNCRACGAKRQRKRDDVSDLSYNPVHTLAMYVPLSLFLQLHTNPTNSTRKRGLVKPPPPKLTDKEWTNIETQSKTRHQESCPICREQFKLSEQVILSCGHVFHRQCLRSFERFVRTSKRSCPICRKQNCTLLYLHKYVSYRKAFFFTH